MTATCHNQSCPISLFEHTEGHGECIPAVTEPTAPTRAGFACRACGSDAFYTVEALEGDSSQFYSCRHDVADVVDLVSDETGYPAVVSLGRAVSDVT